MGTRQWAVCAGLVLVLLLAAVPRACAAEEEGPWPAPVPGFRALKAGEHPRLLFRRTEVPALRGRAKTPEGKAIVKRLRVILNATDGESMPDDKIYTISHTAGFGFLYQLTGDKKYADLGRQCMEKAFAGLHDRDNRYGFSKPDGALRAGPSLGWTAVGYDLCYDGWDEAYRGKVALAIQNYNEGQYMSLAELARGSRHMPASNHWGMQVGGAALALLAIVNDPGVDRSKVEPLLEESQKAMVRNLTEGFGDHGWFPEGDGTGVMASHIVFLPALQAWRVAGGLDFCTPRPNARWTVLKFVMLTTPSDGQPDFPTRGAYPQNVWNREGMSGPGTFCEGFGIVTDPEKAALLWLYNRVSRQQDEKAGAPCETAGEYPHRPILALVNWPFGVEEANPIEAIPPAVGDQKYGVYMFRNRWQDNDDIVISIQTRSTRGWHKADTDSALVIRAQGVEMRWGRMRTTIRDLQAAADGSGILMGTDGTCLAVDFSKASGADCMLIMTGPGAPNENPVTAGGTDFSLKFLTAGEPPKPKVEGDTIVVGQQTVSIDEGLLVLGKMAGPWQGPKGGAAASAARAADDRKTQILQQNLSRRLNMARNYLKAGNKTAATRILRDLAKRWPDSPQGREAEALLENEAK